jgi:hypothetical protein
MDNKLNKDKIMLEQNQENRALCSHKEYIWKNIFKAETLRKETSFRKSLNMYQNLQIKYK